MHERQGCGPYWALLVPLLAVLVVVTVLASVPLAAPRVLVVAPALHAATAAPVSVVLTATAAPVSVAPTRFPTAAPVSVVLAAQSNFSIELQFAEAYVPEVQDLVHLAAQKWSNLINQSHTQSVSVAGTVCGRALAQAQVVAGLRVVFSVEEVDGEGAALAMAGCCRVDQAGFCRYGVVVVDAEDIETAMLQGMLDHIVLHEMGHVLGIGTLWAEPATFVRRNASDFRYVAANANREDTALGRSGGASVEDEGSEGTRGRHWKEGVYDSELMTGFVEPSLPMPLSRLTVAALQDLGYAVFLDRSDAYQLPPARRRRLRMAAKRPSLCEVLTTTVSIAPYV